MINKNFFSPNKLLTILILAFIGLVIYFSREIFYFRYDPEYLENLYYHSQWNIPQSTRGISDGTLYKFVGYRLTQGENPFYLNYQIPPLGKHLYGLATRITGNPYWISLFLYLGSISIFFLLLRQLFERQRCRLLALLLLVTTPFIATQVRDTMLDLPLMFMYLVHTFFFIRFLDSKKLVQLVSAAVFLGLATGVKPGVYTPLVLLLDLVFIYWKTRDVKLILLFPIFCFGGYVLSFSSYFIRHPNPIPWLRLHEKPLRFYLSPNSSVDHLNQWRGIFLNIYKGWWQPGESMSLGDWSPLLPLGVISTAIIVYQSLSKKNKSWLYLSLLTFIFLLVNTFISFWARYLMPIIPLLILMSVKLLKKSKALIIILILLNLPFFYSSVIKKDPTGHIQSVSRFISTRAYRELYRSIDPEDQTQISEDLFTQTTENFLDQLSTRNVNVEVSNIQKDGQRATADFTITYNTRYGALTHQKEFQFQKIHNQWKLNWQWDYIWEDLSSKSQVFIEEDTIPISSLKNTTNQTIAVRGQWKTVWVIPRLMYDWNKHLNELSKVTGQSSLLIDRRIKQSVPSDFPRFVGYLDPSQDLDIVAKQAVQIKGVSLRPVGFMVATRQIGDQAKVIYKAQDQEPWAFHVRANIWLENPNQEVITITNIENQPEDATLQVRY